MEVREMREAEAVLGIIRERGKNKLPLEQVYRQLYNPSLYLRAYAKIARNAGATTPGVTSETVDGMSMRTITTIIDAIRHERYEWSPARRTYIEKKNSTKMRPLGLPTWSDKLVQEVMRSILDAYYDPQFSDRSHGFRPQRGCHTALQNIKRTWGNVRWFIEGDIAQYFDTLDHQILMSILGEQIHDGRFLRLTENLLKAGYLEDWRHHATLSGTPQGGVVSPILSNIYLDRLDKYVETELLPTYNRGIRKDNPEYSKLEDSRWYYRHKGNDPEKAEQLLRQMQSMPSMVTHDPEHRRLRYVRYADDFLLGFNGPRAEAEEIKQSIRDFLSSTLHLKLSEEKTLITHAITERARFLGYEIGVYQRDTKHVNGMRSINGRMAFEVPVDVVKEKCKLYMRNGKPIDRAERRRQESFTTVSQYQSEFRGVAEYYAFAQNRSSRLKRLAWVMQESLVKTLASKFKVRSPAIYKRFQRTVDTKDGPRKVLEIRVPREGKKDLVAHWGGLSLKRKPAAGLNDAPERVWNDKRSELVTRLLADTCELCDSQDRIEVHHIRALKDIQKKGRPEPPTWVRRMQSHNRKTLVLCHNCHVEITHGQPRGSRTRHTGEPGAVKAASPVRRGVVGKGASA
jgi:group II intron reverse transcriptase/maturase